MKNITFLKKAFSVILAVLTVASALVMVGCSDPHEGHDHGNEIDTSILVSYAKITKASSYPSVSAYDVAEVKKTQNTTGSVVLRVVKKEGNQTYCTAGNTSVANFIVVDLPVEATVDEYVLCNTTSYTITSERFGFSNDAAFTTLYVIYGSDMKDAKKISRESAASIFASIPGAPSASTGDSHDGHNH